MKKVIILLICLLIMLAGCSKEKEETVKEEKTVIDVYDPLEPTKEDKVTLTSGEGEIFELERIDSSNRSDADTILELAKDSLKQLYLTDSIISLYFVPCGLAANDFSYDPIMIKTDNDETNKDPLFMTLLLSDENKMLLGTFKESDLKDKNYRLGSINLYDELIYKLRDNLMLEDGDMLCFDIKEFLNLEVKEASNEFNKLYEDTNEHYQKVTLAMWDADYNDCIQVNGMDYPRIITNNINSKADLKSYLEEVFTSDLADAILNSIDSNLYAEVGGKLYYAPIGMGGNWYIQSIKAKAYASDGLDTKLVVECKVGSDIDEDFNIKDIHNEEYLFVYTKVNDFYKCKSFKDIVYGMFEY